MAVPDKLVLLSGPVGAGKTTLARQLNREHRLDHIKTQDCLTRLDPKVERSREALQKLGAKLDRQTQGAWVRNAIQQEFDSHDGRRPGAVVDAVRLAEQIEAIRNSYGNRVYHIHLTAPLDELEARYRARKRKSKALIELPSYADVRKDPTEKLVERLADLADVVIDTKLCTLEDVVVRAAGHLGLYGREYLHLVDVLVGGQFGSEGKGQIAAFLAGEYDALVRVGGPNAGHTVFEEPTPYVFHQLPSGTRINRSARLLIGPGAVLRVADLQQEIGECDVDVGRLSIDPQAMIIDDTDLAKEGPLKVSIGSTGRGVGSATARKIVDRGRDGLVLARNVPALRPYIRETGGILEEVYANRGRIFLEGTQGTGLSIHHGVYPYVTSRDTTAAGCLAEAGIPPGRVRKVIMVCRTYPIRVQDPDGKTSGPMSQPITWKTIADRSGIGHDDLTRLEVTSTTRRQRKVGEFDWQLLRRAASLNAPTDVALTFVDYLNIKNREARRFEQLDDATIRFVEEVERVAAAPVSLISTRFHARGIIDRRAW